MNSSKLHNWSLTITILFIFYHNTLVSIQSSLLLLFCYCFYSILSFIPFIKMLWVNVLFHCKSKQHGIRNQQNYYTFRLPLLNSSNSGQTALNTVIGLAHFKSLNYLFTVQMNGKIHSNYRKTSFYFTSQILHFYTNWKFVATLHQTSQSAPFCQPDLLSLSNFSNSCNISNFSLSKLLLILL